MDQDNFIGNGKHLKVLLEAVEKNDVTVWNSFVHKQGPYFKADLRGVAVEAEDLAKINLRYARLQKAVFKQCDLTKANFEKADIVDAEFNTCNLSGASFVGCNLKTASFEDTELKGIILGRKIKVKAVKKTVIPEGLEKDEALWRKLKQQELQERAIAYNEESRKQEEKKRRAEEEHKKKRESPLFELNEDN